MIIFDKEKHEYTDITGSYKYIGITGIIKRALRIEYGYTESYYREKGTLIHEDIEKGTFKYAESKWVKKELEQRGVFVLGNEALVYDFPFASKIDIIGANQNNDIFLIDVKTGNFDRDYCTLQLSAYLELFNKTFPGKSGKSDIVLQVYCTKDKRVYPIIYRKGTLDYLKKFLNISIKN